jgi:hypothetical protein
MFKLFASKKVDINTQLDEIARNIYLDFNFNKERVVYKLDDQKDISFAYGRETNGKFSIVIGIKDYVIGNTIDQKYMVYYKNTLYHEFVHAESWLNRPEALKDSFNNNKLTYAYWAFKLLDEYRAYGKSNEKYKQDMQFIKSTEIDLVNSFEHYCNFLRFPNGSPTDEVFVDLYYDLGAAFINHNFVNPEFPTIKDKNYVKFVEAYLEHLKQASEGNLSEYKEYEKLGNQLIKDFSILFSVVQRKNAGSSYKYFLLNSHMK